MNNDLYVDNLHRIISKSGEKVEAGSGDLAENFLQKIADDIFLMPPLYSKGFKIKDMLWNYLNLKDDARSQFEGHIISKWKSFQETLKEATWGTTRLPNDMEKTLAEPDKNLEAALPDPTEEEIMSDRKNSRDKINGCTPRGRGPINASG